MLDNLTMSGGLVDRLFVAALVASGVVACGGNSGGSPGAPSPLEPETASCQGAGRAFDGPIAIHDDTHGGPREPVRIDTASGTLCVTKTTVLRLDSHSRTSSYLIAERVISSSAPSGSSMRSTVGSDTSALASATRCLMPPDSWFG